MKIKIKTHDELRGSSAEKKTARRAFKLAETLGKQHSDAIAAYDQSLSPVDKVRLLATIKANLKALKDASQVFPWLELGNLAEVERTIQVQEAQHIANGWYGPNYGNGGRQVGAALTALAGS